MSKIVYDKIKYDGISSSFIITHAFEKFLKVNVFNGYIIFNNKDFVYVLNGELYGIKKLEDAKQPWIANVYELNSKTLILFMNFKNSKNLESLKISSRLFDTLISETLEITKFFWIEIKDGNNLYDLAYFLGEVVGIYRNSVRILELPENELSNRIEVNVFDFNEYLETKKAEILKNFYIKRFENIWQKYKETLIIEYSKEKAEVEFRKLQKELSKKYSILDPLLGIVDIDKNFDLKVQSLNEDEVFIVRELLLNFYSKTIPKKLEKIKEELA
ncbi:MAG: hypothetical protein N2504_00190 [candidate division WOR-3 bacterium]|nr:hypothetical protein [candidate division WOR-3 bacterium]MCX7946999.1 hypothetical protein [candidate division WOR-3 bacterium]MDW8149960.1 hypothetical protein [candidate division WOR-3 bacterium]